jgi:hypothetical protein
VCVTYKDGFWIWWSNLLDIYTTCYNISQITLFNWTLSTSDHTTLIHCYTTTGVKVKVTFRRSVSQSVSLGVEPHLGLMTRYLLLFDSYGLSVGHPLWRENRSVFCICCWPLPAQSFSGPSPLGHATIVYCLVCRRLVRLAGSQWRYWTSPPHWGLTCKSNTTGVRVIHCPNTSGRTPQKTRPLLSNVRLLLSRIVVPIT